MSRHGVKNRISQSVSQSVSKSNKSSLTGKNLIEIEAEVCHGVGLIDVFAQDAAYAPVCLSVVSVKLNASFN